ncbi:ABC1 kinase family protein [Fuerstiella marisgermanici]|uniref:Putative ubiquinone biosynthesis protein UbiB n=1 Tax=Fuerstiella marisgermanici TaxID=1891926 RepID=A0A1P8WPP4_9PLAN|nr:AarF/ABC1/UbiB kinase family protein [Fuerstiella marisgermanici]APZ96032.1 putative ubiquinone biosynthesis protein UbiB [Fuerstiella marisgermanici]
MDVTKLPQLVRNAGRLNHVVQVLVRFGIAPWLQTIPADWIKRLCRTSSGEDIGDQSYEARIRLALTELGTTFIKIGQILSTRPDLIGPELAAELSKLQSGTPPDKPEVVLQTIESELGKPASEVFREFNADAFASGSIGQVHKAVLPDGTPVVVKVQHRGIEERVRNDLEILTELAHLAETYSKPLKQLRAIATAKEFRQTLENELDFSLEQRHQARFARNFADDPQVRVPAPFPDRSSRRVLTMELLSGVSLADRDQLRAAGFDLSDLASRGAEMFLQMVFRDGFYHADPHPGNLMVLDDRAIGLLDCGMVGRVDDDLREQIEDLLLAAIDQDAASLLDSVVRIGKVPATFDRDELKTDLLLFVDEYASLSIDDFDVSGALNRMMSIIRRHHVTLPPRVSLLIKMLVMLEGTAQQLTPDFSLAELLEPYRFQALKRRFSPVRIWRKLQTAQRDWTRLAEAFPGDVADIMNRFRRGSFNVHLEHQRLDSIVNRLVMGVLSSSLFVGSASLWSSKVEPIVFGASLPGAVGCGVAIYLGAQLIFAIRKSGNLRDDE